jgi:hypothetical protein
MTSEVVLEESEVGSTDPNILIDNNCMDEKLHFVILGGSEDFEDEGDESNKSNAIPTASQQRWAATEQKRFDLETSDVDGYECEDGDDADGGQVEEASQADDGSTQNVED